MFNRRTFGILTGCVFALGIFAYVFWRQSEAPAQLRGAVLSGDAGRVRLLLNCGADVNARFDPDYQILWGDGDGQQMYGAAYTKRYWTPLATAASTGNVQLVRLLLSRGADVAAKGLRVDPEGGDSFDLETPLYWAATQGHPAVVRLLLRAGADVDSVPVADVAAESNVPQNQRLAISGMLKDAREKT